MSTKRLVLGVWLGVMLAALEGATSAHATAYVSGYEAIQKQLGGEIGVEPVGAPSEKGEQQVNLYLTRKGYTLADLSR